MPDVLEIATSTPRPGRRFQPIQELELHKDALKAARALPGANRGLVVVPEFAGPLGIPDFTAYVGDINKLKERNMLNLDPVVNEIEAGILSATKVSKDLSLRQISLALGWPESAIRSRLEKLVKRGILNEVKPERYVRQRAMEPGGRLYAIETKVNDWRSALLQVRTYRVWADNYVLVMGQLSESVTASLADTVTQDQGGLMVAGRWVVRPRLGKTSERRRVQAWELLASATSAGLDPPLASRVHP